MKCNLGMRQECLELRVAQKWKVKWAGGEISRGDTGKVRIRLSDERLVG